MKNNSVKRLIALAAAAALVIGTLAGCSGSKAAGGSGAKKIIVGVVNDADRFGSVNENGELDGYEVALLKAVDEKLDDYEFELQGLDFANILLSLDTGKIDLGTHMLEYNDERAEKYYYAQEGIINFSTYFIVPIDSDADTWDTMAGKVVGMIEEIDNSAITVKKYNEENPDKAIELDYFGHVGDEVIVSSLLEGRFDAVTGLGWTADQYNGAFGNGKDIVKTGEAINSSLAYYLYPKDDEHKELRDAVDKALAELRSEGKLKELAEQYFGFDITPDKNVKPGEGK